MPLPPIPAGTPVGAIDTPALVIDLDAMERNLAAMAAFAAARGVRLRPHAKMHKCAELARRQIAAGAVGICVQKTSEAEALAAAGIDDVFVSNEVIDPAKLERVAALAGRIRLAIAVDSDEGIDRLAAAVHRAGTRVDVFVEVDVGQRRCGVPPARAGTLAARVAAHGGLRFAGLQAYHGSAQHLATVEARRAASRSAAGLSEEAIAAVRATGLDCPLVTGSGTGTVAFDAEAGPWGEWQAGSYLFMDREYADLEPAEDHAPRFEHALFVKSQVMSRAETHVVVDAGLKAFATDAGPPRVADRPLAFRGASDEHAVLLPVGDAALPALGATVWLIPGHCDPTVNLHDRYVAVRGGRERGTVEATWPIDARGALT